MRIMEIINSEDNRVLRINYLSSNKTEVVKSHTYSYLSAREMYQNELKQTMGFDKMENKNEQNMENKK